MKNCKKDIELYQLELDQALVDCGMSYFFRLNDGRYFIIDGGYFTPGEEDRLLGWLKDLTPFGEKPVIAGWFFTHGHQDHVGNFIQFVHKYKEKVEIQKLLFQFQPMDFSHVKGDWREKCNDLATVQEFYRTLEQDCPEIPVEILHTGDAFSFGELEIDVLYTAEDLYPTEASFNDYSAVISVTVSGQKILFLGDIGEKGCEILLRTGKERLSCDLVQVSHHGFNGATKELYEATGAKVLLWPAPEIEVGKNQNTPVNQFLLKEMGVQECFVSGKGTVRLELPYEIGTAYRYPKQFFHLTQE